MVGAVREPDHGPQAFHAHALSLTDLLDENRLLPVGQVFRVCTRLFSQQLQRAPADRDLDVELPLLPPLPLDVGVQLVQTGLHPRQPLLHRRQRVRQTVRIPRTGGHRAHPEPRAVRRLHPRVFPCVLSPRASPWIRRASVVSILARPRPARPVRRPPHAISTFRTRPPPPPSASTPRAPARVSACAGRAPARRSTP